MVQRIVLVGAGRTGDSLVRRLSRIAPVVVLDTSPEALALDQREGGDAHEGRIAVQRKEAGGRDATESFAERAGSALHMPVAPPPPEDGGPTRHDVHYRLADGSSRLVLEDLRGASEEAVAVVATTGSDRTNLEVCRLASELGYHPVVAIVIDPAQAADFERCGAHAIPRATLLGDVVERAIQYEGLAFASNVGLGQGDVIEVRVLPSSPAVGVPLSEISPTDWRVAAIYRDGTLVIPTGETKIEAEDRVLVVGQPDTLPYVAANLRKGVPDFPRRYGSTLVVYLPGGRSAEIEPEAEVLARRIRVSGLVRVHPGATPTRQAIRDEDVGPVGSAAKWIADSPLEGVDLAGHMRSLIEHHPGVVVVGATERTWTQRLLGRAGRDAELCDRLAVPVLFPRGDPECARVVFVLTTGTALPGSPDAAIDLCRMLELPLHVVRVDLPRFFSAPDPLVERLLAVVERRALLYGVTTHVTTLEGNPVRALRRFAHDSDLLVVARTRSARDSFINPDVAMRVARAAPCSTLVITQ